MSFFEIAYVLMITALVAGAGLGAISLLGRRYRRERIAVDGDCRETRLIEQGESIKRDCDE